MDDIAQFVRDRLDEEAEAATKAGGDAWRFDAVDSAGGLVFDSRDRPIMESASDPGRSHGHDRTAADHHQAAHVVRHNPKRALAEVDAKRQIVDAYEDWQARADAGEDLSEFERGSMAGLYAALRILADASRPA